MAYNAGDVEARLELDRSPFITGLKQSLREAEKWRKDATKTLHPQADIDRKPFTRSLTAMQASATKFAAKTYTAKVRVDAAGQLPKLTALNNRLTALGNRKTTVAVNVNIVGDAKVTELHRKITVLPKRTRVVVEVVTGDAIPRLTTILRLVNSINGRHPTVTVTANTTRAAQQLALVDRLAAAIGRRRPTVTVTARTSKAIGGLTALSKAAKTGGSSMFHLTNRMKFFGAAITVVAAPAIGTLTTLLATLPFVAAAAGLAIGTVAAGMKGIEEAVAPLAASFERLKPAVDAVFRDGMAPLITQINSLMPMLGRAMVTNAEILVGWMGAVTGVVMEFNKMGVIQQILNNINAGMRALTPLFAEATRILLIFTQVGAETFGALVVVLNEFATGFRQMVQHAQATGVLAEAFRGLALTVGGLLQVFTQLFQVGFQMMATLGPSLNATFRTFGDLLVAMAPVLTQISKTFMDLLVPIMQTLVVVFQNLGPPVVRILDLLGTTFAGILVAIMPLVNTLTQVLGTALMAALDAIAPILPVIVDGFRMLATALQPLAQQIGPILVDVIGALAPLFPVLANAFRSVLQAVIPLIPQLAELALKLLPLIPPVVNFIARVLIFLIPIVVQVIQWVANFVSGIIDFIDWLTNLGARLNDLNSLWTTVWGSISTFFTNIWNNIINFITVTIPQAWQSLIDGAGRAVESVLNFFRNLPENMGYLLGLVIGTVIQWGMQLYTAIETGVTRAIEWFRTLPARIQAFFAGAALWLFQAGLNLLTGLRNGITSAYEAVTAWFDALPGNIVAFFVGAALWLATTGRDIINGLGTGIYNAYIAVRDWFNALPTNIQNFFVGAGEWLYNVGRDILLGMLRGLGTIMTTVTGWIGEFIGGFIQGFKDALGIASPSTIFDGIGRDILNGLIRGLQNMAQAVYDFFSGLWDGMRNIAITAWQFLETTIRNGVAAFTAFWLDRWAAISAFFSGIWDAIVAWGQRKWTEWVVWLANRIATFIADWNRFWTGISEFFSRTWDIIVAWGQRKWAEWNNWMVRQIADFITGWNNFWNGIYNFFSSIWDRIVAWGQRKWDEWAEFFRIAIALFVRGWTDQWNNIINVFSNIWSGIVDIAKDIWNQVQTGFVNGVNAVIGIINGFADVINTIAGLVGIQLDLHMDPLPAPTMLKAGGEIAYTPVIGRAKGGDVSGGGRLPGYSPGRDSLPAMAGKQPYLLGGGEFITNARATRAIGPSGMAAINNAHRTPVAVIPRNPNSEAQYANGGPIRLATGGQLGALVQQNVPGTRITSTHRPGVRGYHGSNQAADLAGPSSMDTPFMHRINQWIASNYGATSNELIFTPGINLLNGAPHTYNAATRADHNDHVHWAHTGPVEGATGSAGEGFIGSIINFLHQQVAGLLGPIRGALSGFGDQYGFAGQMAVGAMNKVLDGLLGLAGPPTMPGGVGPGMDVSGIVGPVQDQVRQVAARFGWNQGAEWDAILRLVQKESSWKVVNPNPTSSADGLFQKMQSIHGPVEPTAAGQAAWGLDYIRGRYGTPSAALRFHNANNYYDDGGILQPGPNLAFNATQKPEAVLTSPQWQSLMEVAQSARELVNHNSTVNNGLSLADIERIIAKLVELRPLIGNVQQQLPHGVSPEKMIEELSFELRHVRKGQYE